MHLIQVFKRNKWRIRESSKKPENVIIGLIGDFFVLDKISWRIQDSGAILRICK